MTSIHHVLHAAQGIFSCGTRLLALAYGIYFPDQGSNQGPLHSKCGVLATGLPGKFLLVYFFSYSFFFFFMRIAKIKKKCLSLCYAQLFATPRTVAIIFLCTWNCPGNNTRVDSHSLLQGIFQALGPNPGLLHCLQILYHLSQQESPN